MWPPRRDRSLCRPPAAVFRPTPMAPTPPHRLRPRRRASPLQEPRRPKLRPGRAQFSPAPCLSRLFLVPTMPRSASASPIHESSTCLRPRPKPRAAEAALEPGRPIGEVFDAQRACSTPPAIARIARMRAAIRWATPSRPIGWIGRCSIRQSVVTADGNVFFIRIIVFDEANELAMTLGRASDVTARGAPPLSKASLGFARAQLVSVICCITIDSRRDALEDRFRFQGECVCVVRPQWDSTCVRRRPCRVWRWSVLPSTFAPRSSHRRAPRGAGRWVRLSRHDVFYFAVIAHLAESGIDWCRTVAPVCGDR